MIQLPLYSLSIDATAVTNGLRERLEFIRRWLITVWCKVWASLCKKFTEASISDKACSTKPPTIFSDFSEMLSSLSWQQPHLVPPKEKHMKLAKLLAMFMILIITRDRECMKHILSLNWGGLLISSDWDMHNALCLLLCVFINVKDECAKIWLFYTFKTFSDKWRASSHTFLCIFKDTSLVKQLKK